MTTITSVDAVDVRFPTSLSLDGSDAMNPAPDYSAAYAIVHTDDESLTGHGFTFTIGRGNEVCVAAIEALRPLVVGRSLEGIVDDMRSEERRVGKECRCRWSADDGRETHKYEEL